VEDVFCFCLLAAHRRTTAAVSRPYTGTRKKKDESNYNKENGKSMAGSHFFCFFCSFLFSFLRTCCCASHYFAAGLMTAAAGDWWTGVSDGCVIF
jgi:hypothetical protein